MNTAAKILFISMIGLISAQSYIYPQDMSAEKRYYDPSKRFSVTFYGEYVSSAEVLNNINSTDPIERSLYFEMSGAYGFGAEFNYNPHLLNLDLVFYISSEYIKMKQDMPYRVDNGETITTYVTTEQFEMIPLEFGIKWPLPVSTDYFKIYIGGGSGFYFGKHSRAILNAVSVNVDNSPGFSMNILAGIEYYVAKNTSMNAEFKFREGTFDSKGYYNKQTVLPEPFYTRFIADGTRISVGFKYHF